MKLLQEPQTVLTEYTNRVSEQESHKQASEKVIIKKNQEIRRVNR